MIGYTLPVTCPRCGAALEHVASGLPVAGTEVSAVAECTDERCRRQWHLHVTIRPGPPKVPDRHLDRRNGARALAPAEAGV